MSPKLSSETSRVRRRSARAAKIASRTAGREVDPCPPGQRGGVYKPLPDTDIQAIYTTALRILAEIGMDEVPAMLAEQALAYGAYWNEL